MSDQREFPIALSGGANQDSSPLNAAPADNGVSPFSRGDYPYALNIRNGSSIEDNLGAQENFLSTYDDAGYYAWNGAEFASAAIPTGINFSFSKFEDHAKGNIYYCVHNDSGNHTVLRFNKALRRTQEMIQWSGLNFDPESYVSMCKINKWLILTDGPNNPPRIMLVDGTAPDYTDGIWELFRVLGANFSEYHISFAKWAPLSPPLARSVIFGASDYLDKGIFQYCYRYVFVGGFRTTFSPPSWFVSNETNATSNIIELIISGFIFDYETPANTSFDQSSVKFYEVVEFIEIAYRESTKDSWKLFKRHTVTSGLTDNIVFNFENNGPSVRIPTNQIDQYFDSVPFKSGACAAIDNRVKFGDNEDELPAVTDFDVDNVEVYSVNPASDSWNGPSSAFTGLSIGEIINLGLIQGLRRFSFKERGIYKGAIVFQHFSGRTNLATTLDKWTWIIPSYTPTVPSAVENYNALGFTIPGSVTPPDWAVAYQILRSNCLNIEYFLHGVVNDFIFLLNDSSGFTDTVSTPDRVKTTKNDFFNKIAGVTTGAVVGGRLSDQLTPEIRKNKAAATFADCSRIYMDISNWALTSARSATVDWPGNQLYYNWEPGDRVRFWGSTSASYNVGDLTRFDEEIVEYTGRGLIINKPSTLVTLKNRAAAGPNPSQSYIIEVYRPTKFNEQQSVLFWEMGEWYPITQPTTASRDFSKRDFRWTAAADVTVTTVNGHTIYNKMPLTNGDVWMVEKSFYFTFQGVFTGELTGFLWPQMTQDPTRAGDFWERNTGRPYTSYSYLPTLINKETQIRFGGEFLQDSLFVSINNFRDEWQFIYPAEYGRIRALVNTANAQVESVGNILIAIGEIEAWSIYVNRTTLEDLSGSSQVAISDKVLGSFNTLLGSHGTLNPESVALRNGRLVWWNARKGEWIRYSRDGLTEISDNGMKNWFKDLSDLLIDEYESTAPRVLCSFDQYHKCWITYIDHSSLPATFKGYSSYKCVTFAERNADKRWKEWFDYTPELFASLDNEVYSIIGTQVYIHEAGETFGSIYGVKKDSYIEVIANPEVLANKSWTALAIEASDKWSFESVKGDWRSNTGVRQETRMNLDDLDKKEWTYWTAIKKDKNTPNGSSEQDSVINGENMRGKHLRIMMKLDPDVDYYSVFNYLIVKYMDSPLNPKIR